MNSTHESWGLIGPNSLVIFDILEFVFYARYMLPLPAL